MSSSKEAENVYKPVPAVVHGGDNGKTMGVDNNELVEIMRTLETSDRGIDTTTLYIDPVNRVLNNGTHYSNRQAKLRFPHIPEIQESQGDLVRISAKVRGVLRTPEQMNGTLTHELEHIAQHDRHDIKVTQGHIAVRGLAFAGGFLGYNFGNRKVAKVAGTLVGIGAGYVLGYLLAPHERQARKRAREVTLTAIVSNSHT